MQYTEVIYLIDYIESKDKIGNIIKQKEQRKVYAKKNKVGTTEFYNAVAVGLTPTAELQIKSSNYKEEKEVLYNDVNYSVIRTIPKDRTDIVLVLGKKQGIN